MKLFLLVVLVCGVHSMMESKASAGCSPWFADDSSACVYGDTHDGTPWSRSCGYDTVCQTVRRHPPQGVTCSTEHICLPPNPNSTNFKGCGEWEVYASVDNAKACDNRSTDSEGNQMIFWTRTNTCAMAGGGYPTHFCATARPAVNPKASDYTCDYFDPDDFSNDPNKKHPSDCR
jgi:hypothetical protein